MAWPHPPDSWFERARADQIAGADCEQRENERYAPIPSAFPNKQNADKDQWRDPISLRREGHPKPIPNRMGDEMIEKLKQDGVVLF